MDAANEQALIDWAHEYNGYERLAGSPGALEAIVEPIAREFRQTGQIPEWAGVDLLRGWAFYIVRAHRFSGGYSPLCDEYPEFSAIVDAIDRHPTATAADRVPTICHQTWPHDAKLHAWWVQPGRLLAGEYPGATTQEKAATKLNLLIGAGISTIVDLTTKHDGLAPYLAQLQEIAAESGRMVRHFRYPIPDNGVIGDAGYDAILTRIRTDIDAGRTVYVHCWGGRGRTSTVIGCLLAETGLNYSATIARIAELRSGTRKAKFECPESSVQHDLLRSRCGQ